MRQLLLHLSLFLVVNFLSICCFSVPCSCCTPCAGSILVLASQLHQEKLCFCACLSNLFLDQIPGIILPPPLCDCGNSEGHSSDHLPRHNVQFSCLLLYSGAQESLQESPTAPRFQLEAGQNIMLQNPQTFLGILLFLPQTRRLSLGLDLGYLLRSPHLPLPPPQTNPFKF